MRIMFIGASGFGLKCLDTVYRLDGVSIAGVITNPRTFNISYSSQPVTNVLHADFSTWAEARGIPYFEMTSGMKDPELHDWTLSRSPDLTVVVGWYHMIPRSLREIAPSVGLHASLLPDYSGGAPLVWAMINGEKETGITLFEMDDGVDSGRIIGQWTEPIFEMDTIRTLYGRIEERGLELLRISLPKLASGQAQFREQNEAKRRIFPQRSPKDGIIDWNRDAGYIDRFIRAQTRPYPGAFTTLGSQSLTIWEACVAPDALGVSPGTVVRVGERFMVACAEGALQLRVVQLGDTELNIDQLQYLLANGGQVLGI